MTITLGVVLFQASLSHYTFGTIDRNGSMKMHILSIYAIHTDHLGTPIAMTNEAGQMKEVSAGGVLCNPLRGSPSYSLTVFHPNHSEQVNGSMPHLFFQIGQGVVPAGAVIDMHASGVIDAEALQQNAGSVINERDFQRAAHGVAVI